MSLAAPISDIEVRSTSAAIRGRWSELDRNDLPAWNDFLRRTDASVYQYPFWNEPYRRLWVTPRYLVCGSQHNPQAFVSILSVGFGPAKVGLVFRGPASTTSSIGLSESMLRGLFAWARAQGFIFLRFTHSDPQVLTELASAGEALDVDSFPYMLDYPILSEDYIVELHDSEEETLASFDREARRKIRRGAEAGYQFRSDDSPFGLQQSWTLYQECARRKHFRLERPLSFYLELMRGAQFYNRARLYSVTLNGATVGSTLIVRDRTMAHCLLAAFDAEHRGSAALLHWHSMRDMYRLGARRYNMGPGPGSLARFKSQFCELPARYPGPLTIVLKENWFQLWRTAFVPMAKQLHPVLRRLAFQRAALSR
ncbi:MAG TPA: GNAT family N-acetyltransferase [Candidatus Acidoferrales bacterium]|nr:GNAT family N-acetyltransferase [Candidatus Acidoferrales bacterium]